MRAKIKDTVRTGRDRPLRNFSVGGAIFFDVGWQLVFVVTRRERRKGRTTQATVGYPRLLKHCWRHIGLYAPIFKQVVTTVYHAAQRTNCPLSTSYIGLPFCF